MKNENWSIRKMRESPRNPGFKNTYRENSQPLEETKTERNDVESQGMLSLFLNRVRVFLEE